MANSPCKMHNPKFSYSQIKFPETEIFLARIHLVCQKLIGFIHLLDSLSNLIKSILQQQKKSFANKPIILSKVFAFCCWRSKYFFSQEGNVLFQVSLEKCKIIFFKIFLPLLKGIPQLHI